MSADDPKATLLRLLQDEYVRAAIRATTVQDTAAAAAAVGRQVEASIRRGSSRTMIQDALRSAAPR